MRGDVKASTLRGSDRVVMEVGNRWGVIRPGGSRDLCAQKDGEVTSANTEKIYTQCWINAGPASQTVAQH